MNVIINYNSHSMVKTNLASGSYVVPECKFLEFNPEGLVCVSGEGSIDDGTVDTWSMDGELFNNLPDVFHGIDNSII